MSSINNVVLEVRDLGVTYAGGAAALVGVNLELQAGRVTALVGPSGCGKSTLALAILRLLPAAGRIVSGTIRLRAAEGSGPDIDVLAAGDSPLRDVRGRRIAMIFQSPGAALNPVRTAGAQIGEVLRLHGNYSRRQRRDEIGRLLAEVELDPRVAGDYPHQLSGGMQQRALIAMALAGKPQILLADEPTSALDVTVQAQILRLLARLQQARNLAVLLITHDLAVAAQVASNIHVLEGGRVVESGPAAEVLVRPRSPATRSLLAAARGMAQRLPMVSA